jgi:uncharacterized protein (DUF58 family)
VNIDIPKPVARILEVQRQFWLPLFSRRLSDTSPTRLTRHRLYILPTRLSLILLASWLAILTGAINYNNSLAYLLVFFLLSIFLVSMLHAYRNLLGLTLSWSSAPHYQPACVTKAILLTLINSNTYRRYGISIGNDLITLDPITQGAVHFPLLFPRRGLYDPPRITISSLYPFGLFRVWGYLHPSFPIYVFPQPIDSPTLPPPVTYPSQQYNNDRLLSSSYGDDDFYGFRSYQAGDPTNRIDWRGYSRHAHLNLKEFSSLAPQHCYWSFSLNHCPDHEYEQCLQRITGWVMLAEQHNLPFALELPLCDLPVASGFQHYLLALQHLSTAPALKD